MKQTIKKYYRKTTRLLDSYLQTDSDFLIKGSFWMWSAKIISIFISFGLSIVYARYLSKGTYGSYRYVLSILPLLSFVTLPGIYTAYLRAAVKIREAILRKGIIMNLLLSVPLSILGLAASCFFLWKGNTPVAVGLAIASILSIFDEGTSGFVSWLYLKNRIKERALYAVLYNALSAVFITGAIFVVYTRGLSLIYSIVLLVSAYYIPKGAVRVFFLIKSMREIPDPGIIENEREIQKYGVHLSLSQILGPIGTNLDNLLLFPMLGPEALAVYSFATAIPDRVKSFITSTGAFVEPKILSKDISVLRRLPQKILRVTAFVAFGVLAYVVIAPYLFEFFFPRYMDSVFFSQLFVISLLAIPFSSGLKNALESRGNVQHIYLEKISTQVVQITSIAILIPFLGILGAVIARLIARFYNAILIVYLVRK